MEAGSNFARFENKVGTESSDSVSEEKFTWQTFELISESPLIFRFAGGLGMLAGH